MKPISIQLYTVREQMKDGNHLAVLKQIADIGYKGVEGSGFGLSPKEWRKVVEDLGMVNSSTWGNPTPETVNAFIDEAHELGVKHTVCGFWTQDFESMDALKRTADKLNSVLPAIKAAGLTLSTHNHWQEFEILEGRLVVEHLLELCPDLTLEIDVYWSSNFGANKPEEMVAKFGSRAPLLHIKDGPQVRDEPMTAVGSGTVNLPTVFAAVDEKVTDWYIVELDHCATDMLEAVAESYRWLTEKGYASGNK